jgi:DNA polymerase-1
MLVDSPKQADVVLIVDHSNLAFRAIYANSELATTTGLKSGHVFGSMRMLVALFRDFDDTKVCPIFCYDGKGAKAARQAVCPTYKGNRKPHEVDPIAGVKELVINLPGVHIEQDGLEGDDAIAWAVDLVKGKNAVVHSGDKDLYALMRFPNVKCYSPNKGRMVKPEDWVEEYKVTDPGKIPLAKALFGDASDNIKGVERLIKKQVEPVLNSEKCVDIASFYDMLETKPESMTNNMYQKTLEAKERVLVNYQIILPNTKDFVKESVKRTIKSTENQQKLLEVLTKYECRSVMEDVSQLYS